MSKIDERKASLRYVDIYDMLAQVSPLLWVKTPSLRHSVSPLLQLEAKLFRFGGDDVSFFDVNQTTRWTFSVQMQKGVSLEEGSTKEIYLKEAIEPA